MLYKIVFASIDDINKLKINNYNIFAEYHSVYFRPELAQYYIEIKNEDKEKLSELFPDIKLKK